MANQANSMHGSHQSLERAIEVATSMRDTSVKNNLR